MQMIHQAPLAALGLGAAFTVVYGAANPMAAFAEVREVEAEGYYRMGDGMEERMDIAKQRAIEDATQRAAEKAGVFVESFSATYMGEITRDEVRAIAATVLDVKEPVKVIPEVFADGQAIRYHAYVTAVVDTANIEKMLGKNGDDKAEMVRRNNEIEEELAKVHAEIERLKTEHQRATEAEKQRINEEVKQNERRFEAVEWYKKGSAHIDTDEYEQAIECFKRAIEIDPSYAAPWGGMAMAYGMLQRYDEAEKACRRGIEIDPNDLASWVNLGQVYNILGKPEQSMECSQKAIDIDPTVATPWNNLGAAYYRMGNYAKAEECYKKATQLNPNSYHAWNNLGILYSDGIHDNARAIECMKKASENIGAHKSENATVWSNIGFCYVETKAFTDAADAFHRALAFDADHEYANLGMGIAYDYLEKYDEAVVFLRKAVQRMPQSAFAWGWLADAYRWNGDYENALAAYDRAIELNPDEEKYQEARADVAAKL